jgi:hypothetical protein
MGCPSYDEFRSGFDIMVRRLDWCQSFYEKLFELSGVAELVLSMSNSKAFSVRADPYAVDLAHDDPDDAAVVVEHDSGPPNKEEPEKRESAEKSVKTPGSKHMKRRSKPERPTNEALVAETTFAVNLD